MCIYKYMYISYIYICIYIYIYNMRGGVLRREGSHCKHSCPPLCRVKRCPDEHVSKSAPFGETS